MNKLGINKGGIVEAARYFGGFKFNHFEALACSKALFCLRSNIFTDAIPTPRLYKGY